MSIPMSYPVTKYYGKMCWGDVQTNLSASWPWRGWCDSHSNLTREAKTGARLTVPSSRQKSEPNGSRERLLLDSCSMLSQRLPSWAASPPVGRCSLGDSFTHYSRQHAPEALATIAWLRGCLAAWLPEC